MPGAARASNALRSAAALVLFMGLATPHSAPVSFAAVVTEDERAASAAADRADTVRIIAASWFPVWTAVTLDLLLSGPTVIVVPAWCEQCPGPTAAPAKAEPEATAELQDAALWSAAEAASSSALVP